MNPGKARKAKKRRKLESQESQESQDVGTARRPTMADCHCRAQPRSKHPDEGLKQNWTDFPLRADNADDWRLHSEASRDTRCVRISQRCQANELVSMLDSLILSTLRRLPGLRRHAIASRKTARGILRLRSPSTAVYFCARAPTPRAVEFRSQIEPSDWSFVTNRYGRPFIAAPAIARTIYFSSLTRRDVLPVLSLIARLLALT